jgi:hypothetical protein
MSDNINIDFKVTSDLFSLIVTDFSEWKHIEEKPAIIEITLPGSKNPEVSYFGKKKVNLFSAVDLNASCSDICHTTGKEIVPDGIYKITVKGSPSTFNKTVKYLKADIFLNDLKRYYLSSLSLKYNEQHLDKVHELNLLYKSAEASVHFNNISEAGQKFQKAVDILEKLNNCRNCV